MPALATEAWLMGYLSAVAVERKSDFLASTDSKSAAFWMDNYCKANPLKHIGTAAQQLAKEAIEGQAR